MANYYDRPSGFQVQIGAQAQGTKTGIPLDSNYIHGTGGDAVLLDFIAPESGNLTSVYFFVSAKTLNPTNLIVELRNNSSAKPGNTLHASQTVAAVNAAEWHTATFDTPYSVTQGTRYWVCIGDPDGDGTNYATVLWKGGTGQLDGKNYWAHTGNTANGNAAVTLSYTEGPIILKFAGGSIIGNPYTIYTTDTSNTLMRGIKVAGLTEDLVISGVHGFTSASISGVKIFVGAAAPGDAADLTVTGDLTTYGIYLTAPYTLKKNTVYRIVYTYSGAATVPNFLHIEGTLASIPADVLAAGFGGGTFIHTISDGGAPAAWVDSTVKFPRMALILQDQVNKNVNLLRGKL